MKMVFVKSKALLLLTIIIQFIATVLLSFLLLGCIDISSNYSNVYLLNYSFNTSSPAIQQLALPTQNANTNSSTTNLSPIFYNSNATLSDVQVRVGYLASCLIIGDDKSCSYYTSMPQLPQLSLDLTNNVVFNLLDIAKSFSELCHPHMLMTTVILTLITLVTLCYLILPLPFHAVVEKFGLGVGFINMFLCGLGAMLQHQVVETTEKLLKEMSFGVLKGMSGTRAENMTWVAFSFCTCVFLSLVGMNWTRMKLEKKSKKGGNEGKDDGELNSEKRNNDPYAPAQYVINPFADRKNNFYYNQRV